MKAAVIIVKYRAEREFKACLASVRRSTARSVPIVAHDNGPKNENLGTLWNRLIKRLPSHIDAVIMLNPDTVVAKSWAEELVAGIRAGHAAVGPVTNSCGYRTQIRRGPVGPRRYMEAQALSGFCFALDREIFSDLGGFKTNFPLYGQDSELFMRIRRRARTLAVAPHVFVRHHRSASGRDAEWRGELRLAEARLAGMGPYRRAVGKERRLHPRVLGIVVAGLGQDDSQACLIGAGVDEIHVIPAPKVTAFIRARVRFFEAAIRLDPGQTVKTSKAEILAAVASNTAIEGVKLIRLPLRRGDA